MEFVLISAEKLKVTLSAADMERLGIRYEHLDYTDPTTRKALVSILEQGREEAGFNPRRAKLFIEVYPSEDGGCALYFTCLRTGEGRSLGRSQPGPTPVVFGFEDVDTLILASARVFERYGHRIYKSALYGHGRGYRLIVWPLDYADRLSIYFLSEYGALIGEGAVLAAWTEEHGKPILSEDAIDTLAGQYGK